LSPGVESFVCGFDLFDDVNVRITGRGSSLEKNEEPLQIQIQQLPKNGATTIKWLQNSTWDSTIIIALN
jgi:hypothetical protein